MLVIIWSRYYIFFLNKSFELKEVCLGTRSLHILKNESYRLLQLIMMVNIERKRRVGTWKEEDVVATISKGVDWHRICGAAVSSCREQREFQQAFEMQTHPTKMILVYLSYFPLYINRVFFTYFWGLNNVENYFYPQALRMWVISKNNALREMTSGFILTRSCTSITEIHT